MLVWKGFMTSYPTARDGSWTKDTDQTILWRDVKFFLSLLSWEFLTSKVHFWELRLTFRKRWVWFGGALSKKIGVNCTQVQHFNLSPAKVNRGWKKGWGLVTVCRHSKVMYRVLSHQNVSCYYLAWGHLEEQGVVILFWSIYLHLVIVYV